MKDSEGLRSVLLRMERLGGRPGHPTSPSALAILSKNRERAGLSSRSQILTPFLGYSEVSGMPFTFLLPLLFLVGQRGTNAQSEHSTDGCVHPRPRNAVGFLAWSS